MLVRAESRFAARRLAQFFRLYRRLETGRYPATGGTTMEPLSSFDLRVALHLLPEVVGAARKQGKIPVDDDGAPRTDWLLPLLNVVGDVYAQLDADVADRFAAFVAQWLRSMPAEAARRHVKGLRNARLIADVTARAPDAWPGFVPEAVDFARHAVFDDLLMLPCGRVNTVWAGLAAISNGPWATRTFRDRYYAAFPDLIRDALPLAAARTVALARSAARSGYGPEHRVLVSLLREHYDLRLLDDLRALSREVP